MTLLVRDEIDIIENNLNHHFNCGIDFLIVTDHMSTDGTREFLLEYEAASHGKLHLILKDDPVLRQEEWVNEMGDIAFNEYCADYVIHSDADEFWCAHKGTIKQALTVHPQVEVHYVKAWHCFVDRNLNHEQFPHNIGFIRNNVHLPKKQRRDTPRKFEDPFTKVILKRSIPTINAVRGNHTVHHRFKYKNYINTNIVVLHLPMRSTGQIIACCKNHATAMAHNPTGMKARAYSDALVNGSINIINQYSTTESEASFCISAGYVIKTNDDMLKQYVPEFFCAASRCSINSPFAIIPPVGFVA